MAWNVCVVLFTPRTNVSHARSPLCQTRLILVSCRRTSISVLSQNGYGKLCLHGSFHVNVWCSGCDGCAILLHPEDVISLFLFLDLSVFNFYVTKTGLFMQDMKRQSQEWSPLMT